MRGNELRDFLREVFSRRGDHVALGAPGVGNHRFFLQILFQLGKNRRELRHRRRDQDQIGVPHGSGGVRSDRVDRAALERQREVRGIAPRADHVRAGAGLLQRQRKGAADQADTDHGNAIEQHLVLQARRQGGEELLVLLRGADRDPQVLRQAVAAADRAHDDRAAQQPLEDVLGFSDAQGEEIAE